MKPIIIYLDKRDEIKLSKEEFEKYIREAYDQGYNCGYTDGKKYYWGPYWYGNTITSTNTGINVKPLDIKYTGKEYNPDYTEITCNTGEVHNTIGDYK